MSRKTFISIFFSFLFFFFSIKSVYAQGTGCVDSQPGAQNCAVTEVGGVKYPLTCGSTDSSSGRRLTCCNTQQTCFDALKISCAGEQAINTAIGCIRFDQQTNLIIDLLRWTLGIVGGIALILFIYAGYIIQTSAGDPRRLKSGQELLTSAIAGVIMLIFATVILRFIGFDLLNIF